MQIMSKENDFIIYLEIGGVRKSGDLNAVAVYYTLRGLKEDLAHFYDR